MVSRVVTPVFLIASATACGDEDDGASSAANGANETLRAAVEKMESLTSYRTEIVDLAPLESLPHTVSYVVDIDRDGGYRSVAEMVDGPTTLTCEEVAGGERCKPEPPATFVDAGVIEAVVFKDRVYLRECIPETKGCQGWSDDNAHFLLFPRTGPGWFMPEFPLAVAANAENVVQTESPEAPDRNDVRFTAEFDYVQTAVDAAEEFRTANRDVPGFEEAATRATEEQLQMSLANPLPLEIVIDPDSGLLSRMSIFLPAPGSGDFEDLYEVEITFSRFNEATVERPY